MKIPSIIVLFLSLFALMACKKEIDVPTEETKLLYGKWQLVGITGGFSGGGTSLSEDIETVEFLPNGVSKWYINGKQKEKHKFTFQQGTSITGSDKVVIKYQRKNALKEAKQSQGIFFISQDELLLNNECYDCYSYVYVRK